MTISIRLHGGLGNTLFQYALGRGLAARGKDVVYEKLGFAPEASEGAAHHRTRPVYGLDGFGIEPKFGPRSSPEINDWRMRFDPTIFDLESADLYGHWQCEKYFENVADELRKELVPVQQAPWIPFGENSIGVHVRRGDYLESDAVHYHGVLTVDYYRAATDYIASQCGKVGAFVFSDDPEWCIKNLGVCHSTGNRHWDLYLMAQCRHMILANSSFSWWADFLHGPAPGRMVIAPGKWVATDVLDMQDIYRDSWVKIWDEKFFASS